jgi:hypothetical protein
MLAATLASLFLFSHSQQDVKVRATETLARNHDALSLVTTHSRM